MSTIKRRKQYTIEISYFKWMAKLYKDGLIKWEQALPEEITDHNGDTWGIEDWDNGGMGRISASTIFGEALIKNTLSKRGLQRMHFAFQRVRAPKNSSKEYLEDSMIRYLKVDGKPFKEVVIDTPQEADHKVEDNGITKTVMPNTAVKEGDIIDFPTEVVQALSSPQEDKVIEKKVTTALEVAGLWNTIAEQNVSIINMENKLNLIIALLTNPLIAARCVGVEDIDIHAAKTKEYEEDSVNKMSTAELRDYSASIGCDTSQVFYRDAIIKTIKQRVKEIEQITIVSNERSIPMSVAVKAVKIHKETGMSIENVLAATSTEMLLRS